MSKVFRSEAAKNLPRSQRVHDLFDTLELDEGIQGYLDWITGVMQIQCAFEEFQAAQYDGNLPSTFAETILHEGFHAFQIALLGYLSRFAITLHTIIANSLPIRQQVADYDQLLSQIPKQIGQSTIYQNIVRDLHRKHGGVSVLDLVEGAAFCAQNRADCDYDTEKYLIFASESHLPSEYTVAFHRFTDIVGTSCNAVSAFPLVANLSLCSHSPPETFVNLSSAYQSRRLTLRTDLPDIIDFCRATDKNYRGFSWEFTDSNGYLLPRHPHFGGVLDAFANHPDGSQLLTTFLLKPEMVDADFIFDAAIDMIMFRPHPDPTNPRFREWPVALFRKTSESQEEKASRVGAAKLHMAIARKLMGTVSIALPSD